MEEIRNHRENNVSFVLRIKQSPGNMIYFNNMTSWYTVYMIKTLLTDYVDFPEDQQRLLLGRNVMENDNMLELYNVNAHSILVVMRTLRGGSITRCTGDSRTNTPALFDEVDSENSDISSSEISDTSEVLFADTSEEVSILPKRNTFIFKKKY